MKWRIILFLLILGLIGLFFHGRAGFPVWQEPSAPSSRILEHNHRGVALMDQFKFEEAVREFQAILEINPRIVAAHVNLGIAHFYRQEYEEAVRALQKALELDPRQVHAHYVLGLIYRNQDRVEEAISAFEKVLERDPEDPSTNYYLGLLYSRQRDYNRAQEYLRRVIEREPYNASAHYNLATALFRSGNREEGQREMEEFRRLQNLFGSTTIGLQYLEQGKYSVAIDDIPEGDLPGRHLAPSEAPVEVRFVEVSREAGLDFRHGGPGQLQSRKIEPGHLRTEIVPFVGSGISFADYDGDGWLDLFIADAGSSESSSSLYRNLGQGRFRNVTGQAGIRGQEPTMASLWGDYDNDGYPDLYLVNYGPNRLFRNLGDGSFKEVTQQTGTGDSAWGISGAFVDYDHDGDLDLFVANFSDPASLRAGGEFPEGLPGAANKLYRNNGNGTFTDVSLESGLGREIRRTVAVVCTDFDNSRDVDFYLVNLGAPNQLLRNLRDGTFQDVASRVQAQGPQGKTSATGADLNKDRFVDFILPAPAGSWLLFNEEGGRFRSQAIQPQGSPQPSGAWSAQFLDFDNDGDLDLLLVSSPLFHSPGGTPTRSLTLMENRAGRWHDVSSQVGLDPYQALPLRGVSVADFDNDGDLDLALNVNGSSPLLLRNDGGNRNHWVSLELKGTNSNKMGIGTKVEIRSGRIRQKLEHTGSFGILGQNSPRIHFGLGSQSRVELIRLLWPGGVLQSETDQTVNRVLRLEELDRKGTSCPILYVWNGKEYRFQTDFLGGSAFGYLLAPGVYNYPDSDEYIKLNREDTAVQEGRVSITMNNQLEEVIYFDQVELVVVDHPADYEIFPDEKLLPGPPYSGFRLFSASNPRPPVSARDGKGRDILPQLLRIDRVYPDGFRPLPFKGYAETHEVILDLGPLSAERVVLLMHAWIDYADSTSNLAASQAGLQLIPPYLQVRDQQGRWVTVLERMGFPAGLPKTMTVDLSGKFLSPSREVRIVTNMRIYWDQILVESGPERRDFRLARLTPERAELRFKGFPRPYSPDGKLPQIYDYQDASPAADWKVHVGGYTRYGEVLPLLLEKDNLFVITRSGDEIAVRFDLSGLDPVPEGWVRDYLVYAVGFGKDMDPNSARPDFVGPLPFHEMSAYPYPNGEEDPRGEKYDRYLQEWNTRLEEEWIAEPGWVKWARFGQPRSPH